jgi:hypothetical protein
MNKMNSEIDLHLHLVEMHSLDCILYVGQPDEKFDLKITQVHMGGARLIHGHAMNHAYQIFFAKKCQYIYYSYMHEKCMHGSVLFQVLNSTIS